MPNHAYILAMLHYSTIANPPRGGSRPGSGATFHLLKGTHSITTTRMAYEVQSLFHVMKRLPTSTDHFPRWLKGSQEHSGS